jgi:hypothetical protein
MLWRLLVVVEKVDKGRGIEGFIARLEDGLRDPEVEI